jgi:hypothetical protein
MKKPKLESRHFYAGHRLPRTSLSGKLFPSITEVLGFDVMNHQLFDASTVIPVSSSFKFLPRQIYF